MDIRVLNDYFVLVIVGICLCIGYIIKTSLNFIPNKYIPLIMGIIGVVLNVWTNNTFNAEILLSGLFSGLASTGLNEAFRNIIEGDVFNKKKKKKATNEKKSNKS